MRRLPAVLLACAAALAVTACGNKEDHVLVGETEGIYIDIGDVKYQVQMSRILNPASLEDRAYIQGLPGLEQSLEEGETWFGVWMRAENESPRPQPKADEFEIRDTTGEVFEPLEQDDNPFAWATQPDTIPPEGPLGIIPIPDSPAAESTIQGSLLLFKMPYDALENRPLELEFRNPSDPTQVGRVDLDV